MTILIGNDKSGWWIQATDRLKGLPTREAAIAVAHMKFPGVKLWQRTWHEAQGCWRIVPINNEETQR